MDRRKFWGVGEQDLRRSLQVACVCHGGVCEEEGWMEEICWALAKEDLPTSPVLRAPKRTDDRTQAFD